MDALLERHRAIYGELDPFALAPFLHRNGGYGAPLSPEDHRLACLLDRAIREHAIPIQVELVQFMSAVEDGHRYDRALHLQQLLAMLEHSERPSKAR